MSAEGTCSRGSLFTLKKILYHVLIFISFSSLLIYIRLNYLYTIYIYHIYIHRLLGIAGKKYTVVEFGSYTQEFTIVFIV